MPFEFGLDLACRIYGGAAHSRKKYLVLDSQRFRYQASISDISGQDIASHDNNPSMAIRAVRNFLRIASGRRTVPAASQIIKRFAAFTTALPDLAEASGADRDDLQFVEYVTLSEVFIQSSRVS